jgi:hypothetical protein
MNALSAAGRWCGVALANNAQCAVKEGVVGKTVKVSSDLALMLNGINQDPTDRVQLVVTADMADEQGEASLATMLRTIAKTIYPSVLPTGSRVYGIPTPDSDWDWVLQCTFTAVLSMNADEITTTQPEDLGTLGIDYSMRFGPVNLLVVTTLTQFNAWLQGTKQLIAECPVVRDRAVEVFQEYFRASHLGETHGGVS